MNFDGSQMNKNFVFLPLLMNILQINSSVHSDSISLNYPWILTSQRRRKVHFNIFNESNFDSTSCLARSRYWCIVTLNFFLSIAVQSILQKLSVE